MARIRTIKPEFWEDEKIGLLSHGARLLLIGCFNLSDDEGLLRWNEMFLGSSIFPYDDIKADTIRKWMTELENNEIVFPYSGGISKQKIGWIVNFLKHQRIDKPQPSKFDPPSIQNREVKHLYGKRDGMVCQLCGGDIIINAPVNECGSKRLSLDHIEFKSKGGNNYPSNIRSVHIGCNKSRRDNEDYDGTTYSEWFKMNPDSSENDSKNDYENDSTQEGKGKELGRDKEKESKKAEIIFPFSSEAFKKLWSDWKIYRKDEFRKKYKTAQSEQAALKNLSALAGNDEETAKEIIMQSIANQWQGLFELKNKKNGNKYSGYNNSNKKGVEITGAGGY